MTTLCTSGFVDDLMFSHNRLYIALGVGGTDPHDGRSGNQVAKFSAYFADGATLFDFVVVHNGSKLHVGRRSLLSTIALLWPPYVLGQAIIFLPCGFFLLSSSIFFFFFSSPNLSGRRLDVYHTLTHGVVLV